ncbi:MAG: SsrA-binding protein [Bacteroidaceae bacterium]|jgi:SsrA-binding protein|nr:SsrA-binding protein [Bacteroidaceae bacterium]MBR6989609.1 SsrA-binding protein [Bacteroidaceae bacterium]
MSGNKEGKKIAPVNIKNKRASFDYEFIDLYTCGIVLTGTEIKSIRQNKASLVDTYCIFIGGELWVKNMHIAEYFYGSYNNHQARRDRKLLLTKKELRKLQQSDKVAGLTIVPVRMFINEKGLCKVVIALAKGKKEYDKRESLKEKDDRREMDRIMKKF